MSNVNLGDASPVSDLKHLAGVPLGALNHVLGFGMVYQVQVDADGSRRRFTYVSPSCLTLNGVSPEAVMADANVLYDLIAPEHRAMVAEAEARAFAQGVIFDVEAKFILPDGAVRWNRLTSSPRLTDDGDTVWEGIQFDITAQKLAQVALEDEQRRLSLAADATGLGLWEYDIVADRLMWSARTKTLFGLDPATEMTFEAYRASIHPDDRDRVIRAYEAARDRPGGGDFSFEHRTLGTEGSVRWLLAHGRVTAGPDGRADRVIGTSMDITQRKAAEETRILLFQELNHRVKNNFQVIASMLQMQSRQSASPETVAALKAAVDRVMAIARAHANLYAEGRVGLVDIAAYLHDLCGSLDQGLLDHGRITLKVNADHYDLDPDRTAALGMLVNELITNAVKHAFKDGARGCISVDFKVESEGQRLIVSDDGSGFAAAAAPGSGLGSRLIEAFARQARGKLDRSAGGGACVTLTLEP